MIYGWRKVDNAIVQPFLAELWPFSVWLIAAQHCPLHLVCSYRFGQLLVGDHQANYLVSHSHCQTKCCYLNRLGWFHQFGMLWPHQFPHNTKVGNQRVLFSCLLMGFKFRQVKVFSTNLMSLDSTIFSLIGSLKTHQVSPSIQTCFPLCRYSESRQDTQKLSYVHTWFFVHKESQKGFCCQQSLTGDGYYIGSLKEHNFVV